MSSEITELKKIASNLSQLLHMQRQNINTDYDRGYYNGLVMAKTIIDNKRPVFIGEKG